MYFVLRKTKQERELQNAMGQGGGFQALTGIFESQGSEGNAKWQSGGRMLLAKGWQVQRPGSRNTDTCTAVLSATDLVKMQKSCKEAGDTDVLKLIANQLFKNWKVKSESERCSVVSDSLQPHGLYSPRNSPGQNTRLGSHSLLQGIFPTQESNPGLPLCR